MEKPCVPARLLDIFKYNCIFCTYSCLKIFVLDFYTSRIKYVLNEAPVRVHLPFEKWIIVLNKTGKRVLQNAVHRSTNDEL
jgi:hypothetical protein